MAQETQTGALYQLQGVEWGGKWEGGSNGRGHMGTYGWVMLRFNRKQWNSVKQLSFNKKNKEKKKIKSQLAFAEFKKQPSLPQHPRENSKWTLIILLWQYVHTWTNHYVQKKWVFLIPLRCNQIRNHHCNPLAWQRGSS